MMKKSRWNGKLESRRRVGKGKETVDKKAEILYENIKGSNCYSIILKQKSSHGEYCINRIVFGI